MERVSRSVKDTKIDERRRDDRHLIDCEVRWCKSDDNFLSKGYIRDVSSGGCFLETEYPQAVGTVVFLKLPQESGHLEMMGVVRYTSKLGMGVRFFTKTKTN